MGVKKQHGDTWDGAELRALEQGITEVMLAPVGMPEGVRREVSHAVDDGEGGAGVAFEVLELADFDYVVAVQANVVARAKELRAAVLEAGVPSLQGMLGASPRETTVTCRAQVAAAGIKERDLRDLLVSPALAAKLRAAKADFALIVPEPDVLPPPEKKEERRLEDIGAVVGGFTGAVLCLLGVGGAVCIQNARSKREHHHQGAGGGHHPPGVGLAPPSASYGLFLPPGASQRSHSATVVSLNPLHSGGGGGVQPRPASTQTRRSPLAEREGG